MATVKFHTGTAPEIKTFIISRDRICDISIVCSSAFNSHFLEGHTQSMVLDDIIPSVFQLLADYLDSTGAIIELKTAVSISNLETPPVPYLFQLCVLADRLVIQSLQYDTLYVLRRVLERGPLVMAKHIDWVNNNTLERSDLRSLVVKHFRKTLLPWGQFGESANEMFARATKEPQILMSADEGGYG